MNVDIRDKATLEALDPVTIIRFLRSREWRELKRVDGEVAIFERRREGHSPSRVWIPMISQFGDFAEMMMSVLRTVSETEERSQIQLLDDFQTTALGDVIRVGSEDPLDIYNHTLPFLQGIALHEQARSMAHAGALSAASENKRAVYSQSSKQEIQFYMKNLRLAQSERGSFVVRMVSPIKEKGFFQSALPDMPPAGPFERLAVTEMVRGLKALQYVAHESARMGKFYPDPYMEVIEEGVSANLCEAVVPSTAEDKDTFRSLRISVTWCDVVPTPPPSYNQEIQFPTIVQPYIKEAAKEFRKREPEEITLHGAATDFSRDYDDVAGEVRIYGVIRGRARYVRVKLSKSEFDLAMQANRDLLEVSVTGTLVFRLNVPYLDNPRNFHILEQDQDDGKE